MHQTVTNFYCDSCGKICAKEEIVQIILPTTGKDDFVATFCAMPFCNVELCEVCAEKVMKFIQSLNIDFQGIAKSYVKSSINAPKYSMDDSNNDQGF